MFMKIRLLGEWNETKIWFVLHNVNNQHLKNTMGKTFGTYDRLYVAQIKFLEESCSCWTPGQFEIMGFSSLPVDHDTC